MYNMLYACVCDAFVCYMCYIYLCVCASTCVSVYINYYRTQFRNNAGSVLGARTSLDSKPFTITEKIDTIYTLIAQSE